ncbi:ABC transporter substrate-binding protein [Peristeroidobacter soli]|uniref:ABC transporter substrate-binding protein n=1 Tax=Peristeroidobacter soli TaxID=2497877 RepID=UPI00130065CA|nr:ABC transporter substrate-binding protein [Peristeroidobacter soli]
MKIIVTALCALSITGPVAGAERRVRVGTPTPTGPGTARLTAGIELGYFKEEGLDLELLEFPTTVPIMKAVAAKEVDIGGGGVFPLVVSSQYGKERLPIKFFYNHIRKFGFEIVVPPESPLHSIADLKGKRLGILSLTAPYAPVTRVVLKENGLSASDVELVAVGENRASFDLLTSGKIDAYETFIGNSSKYEGEGKKLKRLPYSDRIKNLLTYSYYAHNDTFANQPEVLIGFGRGIAKSLITCNIAPEWCVKTLWKYYPHLKPAPHEMEDGLKRQVYTLMSTMPGSFAFPPGPRHFGQYPENSFENLIDVLYEGGELTTRNVNKTALYTNEFVDEINKFDVSAIETRALELSRSAR